MSNSLLKVGRAGGTVELLDNDGDAQVLLNGEVVLSSNPSAAVDAHEAVHAAMGVYTPAQAAFQKGLIYTQAQSRLSALLNTYSDLPVLPRYTFIHCDLSATVSGSGIPASPYTAAQVNALANGGASVNMTKKALAIKRDSVTSTPIILSSVYADPDHPFIICPYGDSGELPLVDLGATASSWSAVSGTPLYRMATPYAYMPVWQRDYVATGRDGRYYNIYPASLQTPGTTPNNALIAAGPGYCYYASGFVYIYPYSSNPNDGGIITPNTSLAATVDCWRVTIGSGGAFSTSGNILISGLAGRHQMHHTVTCNPDPTNAPTHQMDNVRIVNIQGINGGGSVSDQGTIGDGIALYGRLDTNLLTNGYVAGTYFEDIGNNNIELAMTDNCVSEFNISNDCIGHGIIELWQSNVNTLTQFSEAHFDQLVGKYDSILAASGQSVGMGHGVWVNGTKDDASTYDGTKSYNNVTRFNLVNNCDGWAYRQLGSANAQCYNNTFITHGAYDVADLNDSSRAGFSLDYRNNIHLATTATYVQYLTIGSAATSSNLTGGNNTYFARNISNIGSSNIFYYNSTSYATPALLNAALTTFDANSRKRNPMLDANGEPFLWSPDRGIGHTAVFDPIFDNFDRSSLAETPSETRNKVQRIVMASGAAFGTAVVGKGATLLEIKYSGADAAITSATIPFPASPNIDDEFGIASDQAITTLTLSTATGSIVAPLTSIAKGGYGRWKWTVDSMWLRVG